MNKDTFCPLKWTDLHINVQEKYAYGCCFAEVGIYHDDPAEIINPQKENLLNGIKDPSCEYCWKTERNSGVSKRLDNLKSYTFEELPVLEKLEINLGNLCNYQCIYCGPKNSTIWNNDVKQKEYKTLVDKKHYSSSLSNSTVDENLILSLIDKYKPSKRISFIGGEPLINPVLKKILNKIDNIEINFVTNLSKKSMDKFEEILPLMQKRNLSISLLVSADNLNEEGEFIRYGFNSENFKSNIYKLDQLNIDYKIASLITAQTIWNFPNLYNFIKNVNNNCNIGLSICERPKIHSFAVLNNEEKIKALEILSKYPDCGNIDVVKSNLMHTQFSKILRKDMQNFYIEFSNRRKLAIPNSLRFLFNDYK